MRRRTVPVVVGSDVPWELALGRCVEVWTSDKDRPPGMSECDWRWHREFATRRRYSEAFYNFRRSIGLTPDSHYSLLPDAVRGHGRAWSYVDLEQHDAAELAARLARAALPVSWRPEGC